MERKLTHADLLQLKRWNTPTIYNGWEQITKHNSARDGFNLEPVNDYMLQMGPMVGYAVTVVVEPSNPDHPQTNPDGWEQYRAYMASIPGPKIVVVQDLDKPTIYGAFWGEVNSNIHKSLGCVGTITDGGIRDTNECNTMIQSARSSWGKSPADILSTFNEAVKAFGKAAAAKFGKKGEFS